MYGVSMCSPISVTIAKLVMKKVEQTALNTFMHTLFFFFFQSPLMSVRVAGAAAQD